MKIFFFGFTSFVGKNLFQEIRQKYNLVLFSRNLKKSNRVVKFDLERKKNNLSFLLKNLTNKDYIFFFSSYVPKNESKENWYLSSKINIYGLINFLNEIKKKFFKKIVLSSSCSVYGYKKNDYNENIFLNPESDYAISKIAQENIIRIFCNQKKIKYFIPRLGYVFGKDISNQRIVKKILLKKKKQKKIKIFNKQLNLNLIHLTEVTNIISKNFKNLSGVFNLTSLYETTLEEFLAHINEKKYLKKKKKNYFSSKKIFKQIPNKPMDFKQVVKKFINEH